MTMTTTTTTNDLLPLRKAATTDGLTVRPPGMPRLESLPPIPPILSPTLSADGSATPRLRLAPSVVRRPDALPLARMPSLAALMEQHQHALEQQALRTPTHRPRPSARSSLRVMPRLPLFGEDAPPQPTAVHEIDEEDDDDEDESSAEDAPTAAFAPVVDSELEADTDDDGAGGGMVPASSSKTITLRPIPPPARARTTPAPVGSAAWTLPPIAVDAAPMDLRVPASPVDYFSQPTNAGSSTSAATPAAMATPRPGLQRRVSRSMADLTEEAGSKRAPDALAPDRGLEGQSAPPPGPLPPPVVQHAVSPCSPTTPGSPSCSPTLAQMKATLLTEGPQLQQLPAIEERPQPRRRRSSMPGTIRRRPVHDTPSEPPPPYAPEDGKEDLPEYSNSIYLAALVPRKQEFSAPRVLARDRRWRKVWLVLEGTALKLYRDRSSFSFGGAGGSEEAGGGPSAWRRSRINLTRHQRRSSSVSGPSSARSSEDHSRNSVGDSPASSHTSLETGTGTVGGTSSVNGQDKLVLRHPFDAPSPSQSHSRRHSMSPSPSSSSSMLASTNSHRHSHQFQYPHHQQQQQQPQHVFYRPPVAASPAASTVSLLATHTHAPAREPLRVYSMQHAESGLGSDYVKKPHVVRVRVEGEQFLIQLGSVEEVVQWVEGLQAAANVALDLDERQMPRGPLYPRRRRRRRRPDEVPNPGAGTGPAASSSSAAAVTTGSE